MEENPHVFPWTFALAAMTAALTWFLIMVGGVVHATESSLACPDWPTCYGSFFPEMTGGIFYEHSHRLIASAVGLFTIALAVVCWPHRKSGLRGLGLLALGLVIFQGVLGGLTVIFKLPPAVSISHLGTSMVFFALILWIAGLSFPSKLTAASLEVTGENKARNPLIWILLALALLYIQIVWGALVRHTDSGLACVDLPLCRGSLWPDDAPWQLQIHMVHRILAVIVSAAVILSAIKVIFHSKGHPFIRFLAFSSVFLVATQVALGIWSVSTALEVVPVTAHLGIGALLWANMVLLYFTYSRIGRTVLSSVVPKVPSNPDWSEA